LASFSLFTILSLTYALSPQIHPKGRKITNKTQEKTEFWRPQKVHEDAEKEWGKEKVFDREKKKT